MFVLAGGCRGDARELRAEGPRRHGEGRQGGRDLRVLLIGLSIHAGRGGRGVGAALPSSPATGSAPRASARQFNVPLLSGLSSAKVGTSISNRSPLSLTT